MPDRTPMEDVMRRAYDANLRYWETVGRAATDYVQSVTKLWADAPLSWKPTTLSWTAPRSSATVHHESALSSALVMEGVKGAEVRTVLMISNDLAREAEATVEISTLRGPDGRFASVEVRAIPETLKLAAGARMPVTLVAEISDGLLEGTDYLGEETVPGLSERGVPIVVRRRPK